MSLIRATTPYGETINLPMVQASDIECLPLRAGDLTLMVIDGSVITLTPGFPDDSGVLLYEDLSAIQIEGSTAGLQLQGAALRYEDGFMLAYEGGTDNMQLEGV